MCRNTAEIHAKLVPELNTKRCLKTGPPKNKKYSKNDSQIGPEKCAPSTPKMLPRIQKCAKKFTKETPDCEKELQKSSLFRAWPGGLREALTIKFSF